MPDAYSAPEVRKLLEDSRNPIDLLKKPNKFFWMITAAAALALSLLALFAILAVKLVRRLTRGGRRLRRKDMIFRR